MPEIVMTPVDVFLSAARAQAKAGFTVIPTPLYDAFCDAVGRMEEDVEILAWAKRKPYRFLDAVLSGDNLLEQARS